MPATFLVNSLRMMSQLRTLTMGTIGEDYQAKRGEEIEYNIFHK